MVLFPLLHKVPQTFQIMNTFSFDEQCNIRTIVDLSKNSVSFLYTWLVIDLNVFAYSYILYSVTNSAYMTELKVILRVKQANLAKQYVQSFSLVWNRGNCHESETSRCITKIAQGCQAATRLFLNFETTLYPKQEKKSVYILICRVSSPPVLMHGGLICIAFRLSVRI